MVADNIRYVTCKLDKARFRLYNTLSIEIWQFQAIPGNTILTRALSMSIYFADAAVTVDMRGAQPAYTLLLDDYDGEHGCTTREQRALHPDHS